MSDELPTAARVLDPGIRALYRLENRWQAWLDVEAALARTQEERDILSFQASSLETGRPMVAPPNIPADRVDALRRAFDATMRDRGFLDEAKQRNLEVDPRTGEQVEAVLRGVARLSPELIAKAGELTTRR